MVQFGMQAVRDRRATFLLDGQGVVALIRPEIGCLDQSCFLLPDAVYKQQSQETLVPQSSLSFALRLGRLEIGGIEEPLSLFVAQRRRRIAPVPSGQALEGVGKLFLKVEV